MYIILNLGRAVAVLRQILILKQNKNLSAKMRFFVFYYFLFCMFSAKINPLLKAGFANLKAFLLFFLFLSHLHIFKFFNQTQQSRLQFCNIFLFKSGNALLQAGN